MSTVLISQARLSSTRLPRKVTLPMGSSSALDLHMRRLLGCRLVDKFMLAIADEPGREELEAMGHARGFGTCFGPVHDVLERFYRTARQAGATTVIRVTSDCPLIDPACVDEVIAAHQKAQVDYTANVFPRTLPRGMDCEVMRFSALERAWREARDAFDREHVTPYIWRNSNLHGGSLFSATSVTHPNDRSDLQLSLDTAGDYEFLRNVIIKVGESATLAEILAAL